MAVAVVSASEKQTNAIVSVICGILSDSIEIHTFDSGLSAFKYLLSTPTDTVFTSSYIKHLRVPELVKLIRDRYVNTDISVVMYSGEQYGEESKGVFWYKSDDAEFIRAGANRVLFEPLDKEVIREIVRQPRGHPDG